MLTVKWKKTIIYQEALEQRIVKEGDYFLVQYPDGRNKLFRLVKRNKGYVLWGPPTDGTITLIGKEGYDNLFTLADALVEKEYFSEGVFEEVHACGLSEKEYEVHSYREFQKIFDEAEKLYEHPDDVNMIYFLASRCVDIYSGDADFYVFFVNSCGVNYGWLYNSYGNADDPTNAVRPEATPKSTLLLETKGCDGSKEKPWICLNSQEEIQEENASSEEVTRKVMESVRKSELMNIIQEGRKLIQKESEWLAKLEKYAENLK